jgi:16S rRNA (guanine(966)-N(2))-methyltransferase RsmD
MRVIAGEFRSRRLKTPHGLDVRPTPDRLREALFNVLSPVVPGSIFVDGYAGSGAVGIEALSRGAERAVFLERSRESVGVLRDNLRALDLEERSRVIHGNVTTYLASVEGDIVFLDPPYKQEQEYERVLSRLGERPPPLVIVQHASRHALAEEWGKLKRYRVLRQGDNSLSFYRPA